MLLKQIFSENITGAPWGPKGSIKGGMPKYQKYDKLRMRLNALMQQRDKVAQQLGIQVGERETILLQRLGVITNMITAVKDAMGTNIDLPLNSGKPKVDVPLDQSQRIQTPQSKIDFTVDSFNRDIDKISNLLLEIKQDSKQVLSEGVWNKLWNKDPNAPWGPKGTPKKLTSAQKLSVAKTRILALTREKQRIVNRIARGTGNESTLLNRVDAITVKIKNLEELVAKLEQSIHPGVEDWWSHK